MVKFHKILGSTFYTHIHILCVKYQNIDLLIVTHCGRYLTIKDKKKNKFDQN